MVGEGVCAPKAGYAVVYGGRGESANWGDGGRHSSVGCWDKNMATVSVKGLRNLSQYKKKNMPTVGVKGFTIQKKICLL